MSDSTYPIREDETEVEYALSDCINWDRNEMGDCGGRVEPRRSRTGLSVSIRCENCQAKLDKKLDEVAERYPDTDTAPDWFDESYAGEHWGSDY